MFPSRKIITNLKSTNPTLRITKQSGIFLASVMEYIAAEILELSGNEATNRGRKRILPKDIMQAVHTDVEFVKLSPPKTTTFASGGKLYRPIPGCLLKSNVDKKEVGKWTFDDIDLAQYVSEDKLGKE